MKCQEVIEKIDDHVDGMLPVPVSESIRDHLDVCVECRENVLATKAATASLSTWNDIEPPASCFAEILAKIETTPFAIERRSLPIPVPAPPRFAIPLGLVNRPLGFVNRLTRFQDGDAPNGRRFATSGLAAAAVVLGALLVSQSEPRTTRRQRDFSAPSVTQMAAGQMMSGPALVPAVSVPMFQEGYEIDDGLFRYETDRSKPARALRVSPVGGAQPR